MSLGILGIIVLSGQESQATDFTNYSLPIDNTTRRYKKFSRI